MARKQMLRSVLEGHVKLWMHEQLTDDDRAFLGRWADDWADRAEYVPLWEQLERDVKTGRVGGGAFQELIRCALEARRFASNSEREIDPDFEQKQHRRQELLKLAEMARALADHFREESINASWMRGRDTILMPLVKDIQYRRLSDDHQASFLDLPFAYELVVPAHVLRQLHEREAKLFLELARREPSRQVVITHKRKYRARHAFVHSITDFLGNSFGTKPDGQPHRSAIAALVNINFSNEIIDEEDVRKIFDPRRRR